MKGHWANELDFSDDACFSRVTMGCRFGDRWDEIPDEMGIDCGEPYIAGLARHGSIEPQVPVRRTSKTAKRARTSACRASDDIDEENGLYESDDQEDMIINYIGEKLRKLHKQQAAEDL